MSMTPKFDPADPFKAFRDELAKNPPSTQLGGIMNMATGRSINDMIKNMPQAPQPKVPARKGKQP